MTSKENRKIMEIALYKPEIPPNTGNISRLSVCTGSRMHIIDKPSFSMDEKSVKRAGLDYWSELDLHLHKNWEEFYETRRDRRIMLITKFGKTPYTAHKFQPEDIIVFGRETSGLPDSIVEQIAAEHPERIVRIPVSRICRSLNLSNAVAIVLYEGLRQLEYPGLQESYQD